ncbi:MAG: hypothetical protein GY775_13480 [Candidatus Scalindua sp.]|nr:hypothetical protein [Candidatus Scalindua sp.]
MKTKKKIPVQPRIKFKWWFKNNYLFLIIVGVVCLVAALILIFEVHRHERMRNMEALLQKSRRDMHWGGITDQDVKVLKKRYPDINWDSQYDRKRWQNTNKYKKERRAKEKAAQKLQ